MTACLADWKLTLEYLKVVLSWPPVVLALVLVFRPVLAPAVQDLVRKLRKGKAPGFEFELDQEQKTNPPPTLAAGDHLTRISHDPELAKAEILRWWSAARFENAFNRIFGTQVRLLEFLQSKEPRGAMEAELQPFFLEHQKIVDSTPNAQGSPSWQAFIGFLVNFNFVAYEVRDDARFIRITPSGGAFLEYIRDVWGAHASTRAG